MWVVILEACVAFFLLVFIVWWTMYADRPAQKKPAPRIAATEQPSGVAGSEGTPPASLRDATGQAGPRD